MTRPIPYVPKARLESGTIVGTGWLPPMPDLRDRTPSHEKAAPIVKKLRLPVGRAGREVRSPPRVDLRTWCSPIESQGTLSACTAHAAAGVVEYLERRAFGRYVDSSRRFIYKATRNLMGITGDTGAWLRNTMAALRYCGIPPERYWPYTDQPDFDDEPTAFVYAVADDYEALQYVCHDPLGANVPTAEVLSMVKAYLAAGLPSMFGFFGFPSLDCSNVKGGIPYPGPGEEAQWGHAVAAVGYDDARKVTNTKSNKTTTGALLIRNSWGIGWGMDGYGWLPYEYVLSGLALDFWSLLKLDWVESGQFGLRGL